MGFFLKNKNRLWCGDLKWKIYPRRAGFLTIRKDARNFQKITRGLSSDKQAQMTHYVKIKEWPDRVGFLHVDRLPNKMSINSLLLAVVRHYGAEFYGEFEVGIDQIWVVATDELGLPLPGSDGIYTSDDTRAVRERFSGYRFSKMETLDQTDFTTFVENLPDCPVTLRTLSLQPLIALSVVLLCATGMTGEIIHLYMEKRKEDRARLASARLKKNVTHHSVQSVVRPTNWITACLGTVPNNYFHQGWILQEWSCKADQMSLKWHRNGGTLALSPNGDIMDNGNTILTTLTLHPILTPPQQQQPEIDEKGFLAVLQTHGVLATRTTTDIVSDFSGHGTIRSSTLSFPWQSDLLSLPWDQVKGLKINEISKETTPLGSGSKSTLSGAYRIKAMIVPPNEPTRAP